MEFLNTERPLKHSLNVLKCLWGVRENVREKVTARIISREAQTVGSEEEVD